MGKQGRCIFDVPIRRAPLEFRAPSVAPTATSKARDHSVDTTTSRPSPIDAAGAPRTRHRALVLYAMNGELMRADVAAQPFNRSGKNVNSFVASKTLSSTEM